MAARPRRRRPPDRRGRRPGRDPPRGVPGRRLAEPLVTGLGRLRAAGADALGAALPAEGDPVGLGGPAAFNAAALEAGEAVVALDAAGFALHGLVPDRVGAAVTWQVMPAERRQLPDVGEADRALRAALPEAADALAALDVARWRPEVADRLMNLRHRPRARRAARRAAALRGARRPGLPGAWRSSSSPWRTTAAR